MQQLPSIIIHLQAPKKNPEIRQSIINKLPKNLRKQVLMQRNFKRKQLLPIVSIEQLARIMFHLHSLKKTMMMGRNVLKKLPKNLKKQVIPMISIEQLVRIIYHLHSLKETLLRGQSIINRHQKS